MWKDPAWRQGSWERPFEVRRKANDFFGRRLGVRRRGYTQFDDPAKEQKSRQ